jgi:circadian clock protein KaiC
MTFLKAACDRGERALYFGFEESQGQTIRNMRSIGLDLQPSVDLNLLQFVSARPSSLGLEAHLASMHKTIREFSPQVVMLDPITNFISISDARGVKSMLIRLVDFLKMNGITALFTHLLSPHQPEATEENVSSIMDTWLSLRDIEFAGSRMGAICVIKSRGMPHSHEIRQFALTDRGVHIGRLYADQPSKSNGEWQREDFGEASFKWEK